MSIVLVVVDFASLAVVQRVTLQHTSVGSGLKVQTRSRKQVLLSSEFFLT